MPNELLLILSVIVLYGGVFVFHYFLGKQGLFYWTVLATVAANIEALIVINAFGMEQTLGNVMFASTFLVTDILSETASKKEADKAVNVGIIASVAFVVISQMWLLYTPAETDFAFPAIRTIFSNTPRLMIASLAVYAVCQKFDVWAYHKWWEFTSRRCKKIFVAEKQRFYADLAVFKLRAFYFRGIFRDLRFSDADIDNCVKLCDIHFHKPA